MAFGFFKSLLEKFTGRPVDWDELEEALIRADLGVPMMTRIMTACQARTEKLTAESVVAVAREEILKVLPRDNVVLRPLASKTKVILVVGVNGTGKTTSTAKLAGFLQAKGHSVMLAAADTFRAAAIEQLTVWADRLGVEIIKGQYHADPAALCYEAYQAADRKNVEFLICDTAGRLHTKTNLMGELAKVKRVLQKADPQAPHETLLVVDATPAATPSSRPANFTPPPASPASSSPSSTAAAKAAASSPSSTNSASPRASSAPARSWKTSPSSRAAISSSGCSEAQAAAFNQAVRRIFHAYSEKSSAWACNSAQ